MNNLTWHCELIIRNDAECLGVVNCLTTHVMNRTYHRYDGRAYEDQNRVRAYVLSEFLRNYIGELVDAGNEYKGYNQMTQEIIWGALQEINYREIAENLISDYTSESPAEVAEAEEFFASMGFGNYDIDEE